MIISGVRPPSDWSGLWPEEDASTHSLYLDTSRHQSPPGPGSPALSTRVRYPAGGNNGHTHSFENILIFRIYSYLQTHLWFLVFLPEAYSRILTACSFPDPNFLQDPGIIFPPNISPCASVIPPLSTSPARQATSHHTSTSSLSLSLWSGAASLLPGPHSQYLGYTYNSQQSNIKYPASF